MNKSKILIEALKRGKNKVIDTTSTVLASPWLLKSKIKMENAKIATDRARENSRLRQMDESGVSDKGDESDPLFRYRMNKIK